MKLHRVAKPAVAAKNVEEEPEEKLQPLTELCHAKSTYRTKTAHLVHPGCLAKCLARGRCWLCAEMATFSSIGANGQRSRSHARPCFLFQVGDKSRPLTSQPCPSHSPPRCHSGILAGIQHPTTVVGGAARLGQVGSGERQDDRVFGVQGVCVRAACQSNLTPPNLL